MHERKAVSELTEAQSRLPRFPDGGPPGGPRIRDLAARAVALLALTATAVYLGWRAVATIDIRAPLGAFAVTFTLQQLALWLLGRGWQRPWLTSDQPAAPGATGSTREACCEEVDRCRVHVAGRRDPGPGHAGEDPRRRVRPRRLDLPLHGRPCALQHRAVPDGRRVPARPPDL